MPAPAQVATPTINRAKNAASLTPASADDTEIANAMTANQTRMRRDGAPTFPKAKNRAAQDQEASNCQVLTDGPAANGNKNGTATKSALLDCLAPGLGKSSASAVKEVISNDCDDQR